MRRQTKWPNENNLCRWIVLICPLVNSVFRIHKGVKEHSAERDMAMGPVHMAALFQPVHLQHFPSRPVIRNFDVISIELEIMLDIAVWWPPDHISYTGRRSLFTNKEHLRCLLIAFNWNSRCSRHEATVMAGDKWKGLVWYIVYRYG